MMKLQSTRFEVLCGRVLSCTLGRKPYRCVWLTGGGSSGCNTSVGIFKTLLNRSTFIDVSSDYWQHISYIVCTQSMSSMYLVSICYSRQCLEEQMSTEWSCLMQFAAVPHSLRVKKMHNSCHRDLQIQHIPGGFANCKLKLHSLLSGPQQYIGETNAQKESVSKKVSNLCSAKVNTK